ncbi:MAG TPA: hypothetical protein VGM16_06025, partial [Gammaproteobacteria bacterium]
MSFDKLIRLAQQILGSGKEHDLKYALCKSSFFPEVLPPIFSSESFADLMYNEAPGKFVVDFSLRHPKFYQSQLETYIFRRPANQRRTFGLVHPVTFHALTHEIVQNWSELYPKTQSSCSASSPSIAPLLHSDSAIQPKFPSVIERDRRLDIRTRAKYIVKADITRFYPSIYTHSIAWAISGKDVVKAGKKDSSI